MKLSTRLLGAMALAFAAAIAPALAADLPSKKLAPVLVPVAAPAPLWSGPYVGLSGGYTFAANPVWNAEAYSTGYDVVFGKIVPTYAPFAWGANANLIANTSGFVGGAIAGWNLQAGNFVYGVEGEFGVPIGARKTATFALPGLGNFPQIAQLNASYEWAATFGPRLGFLLTPSLLPYLTGGAAIVQTAAGVNSGNPWALANGGGTSHRVDLGWFVGAGLDFQVAPGWTVGVGYKFVDPGQRTVAVSGISYGAPAPLWGQAASTYIVHGHPDTHVVELRLTAQLPNFFTSGLLFAPTGNLSADLATANANATTVVGQVRAKTGL
jgi:outer membrane immunogenic protein